MKRLINKKLRDLKFPRGMLIVAILRDNDVIIPSGEDELLVGDRIIIFTVAELIHRVEHILRLEV